MWTKSFWKAATERAARAAAAGVLGSWVVADGIVNAFNVNWADAGGIALGSAAFSLLFSVAGNTATGTGPSFNNSETLDPVA